MTSVATDDRRQPCARKDAECAQGLVVTTLRFRRRASILMSMSMVLLGSLIAEPVAAEAPGLPASSVVHLAAVNADATRFVVATSGSPARWGPLQLLDRADGQLSTFPRFVAVSEDLSAVITDDGRWVDVASGASTSAPTGTTVFALSGDGRRYIAGGNGSTGLLVDGPTGATVPLAVTGLPLYLSPNGRWVLVQQGCDPSGTGRCDVIRLDLTSNSSVRVVSWNRSERLASNVADSGRVIVMTATGSYARDVKGRAVRLSDLRPPAGAGELSKDGDVFVRTWRPTLCCPKRVALQISTGRTIELDAAGAGGGGANDILLTADGHHLVYVTTGAFGSSPTLQTIPLFGAAPSRALRANTTTRFEVAGKGAIPADASAVALNVTVTDPAGAGFLVAWPCGEPRPLASNINFAESSITSSFVLVGVGNGGAVCMSTNVDVNVVIDAQGAFRSSSSYRPIVPVRLTDTRQGEVDMMPNLAAQQTVVVPVTERHGVPADASAVTLNLTATNPAAAGYITVWPCDQPRPHTSNLNVEAGETRANAATLRPSAEGTVCAWSNVALDLIIDLQGWLEAPASFVGQNPTRVSDTRNGETDTTPNLAAGSVLTIHLPDEAAAATIIQLTATNGTADGFAVVWACDQPRPSTSNLNFVQQRTATANMTIVISGAGNAVCATANVAVDLVVDVTGIVTPTAGYLAVPPARLLDTRLPTA